MSERYLYALDISLSNTGIAIFDYDTHKLVETYCISTDPSVHTGIRLRAMEQELLKIIKTYKPYKVVAEQGFVSNNTSTQQIFRASGVVFCRFWEYEIIEVNNMTWKKYVCKNGRASKAQIKATIIKLYENQGIKLKKSWKQDVFDAIGVGLGYMMKHHGMDLKEVC